MSKEIVEISTGLVDPKDRCAQCWAKEKKIVKPRWQIIDPSVPFPMVTYACDSCLPLAKKALGDSVYYNDMEA